MGRDLGFRELVFRVRDLRIGCRVWDSGLGLRFLGCRT